MTHKKKTMCTEKNKKRFRMLHSIFVFFMLIGLAGAGLFIYYIFGYTLEYTTNAIVYFLDGTKPPYIGIIVFAVLIASIFGYYYTERLNEDFCK